jgi:hypothetical protein
VNSDHDASASLAGISERLFYDFSTYLGLSEIVTVVRRCRAELDIAPAEALPELVDRLARERLRHEIRELELASRSVGPGAEG